MNVLFGREEFLSQLKEKFPEVAADIDDMSAGLLHLEMGILARATESAVDSSDLDTVARHFEFVEGLFAKAHPELKNAMYVSSRTLCCSEPIRRPPEPEGSSRVA